MEPLDFIINSSVFDPNSIGAQIELVIRLILACLCGAVIGLERMHRLKDAGIRTHVIVAMGAALMMLISKYGFYDVMLGDTMRTDASRVASQIVTGVGFLGAGIIFTKRGTVKGLTTAAGVWGTAGIGMAIGAGMYLIGIVSTALLVFCQFLLHKVLNKVEHINLSVKLKDENDAMSRFKRELAGKHLYIESLELNNRSDGEIKFNLSLKVPENVTLADISLMFTDNPDVIAFTSRSHAKDDD